MASSRLFVRGLPPSLGEQEFKDTFAGRFQVTDARMLARRRFGYIGFKDSEEASKALKYFNKSFIRMSKIHVEFAIDAPRNDQKSLFPGASNIDSTFKPSDSEQGQRQRQKRKRDEPPSHNTDAAISNVHEDRLFLIEREQRQNQQRNQKVEETQSLNEKEATDLGSFEASQVPTNGSDDEWMRSKKTKFVETEENILYPNDSQAPSSKPEIFAKEGFLPGEENKMVRETANTDLKNMDEETAELMTIRKSSRLFIRNLPYNISEKDLQPLLGKFQSLLEIHVPIDPKTNTGKGFAFVQFTDPEDACTAYQELDKTIFQGRLLHVLAAASKRGSKYDEFAISQLPLKKQKQYLKKASAESSNFNWNFLFMNHDAVMSSVADRMGVAKSEMFDASSSEAAVTQAKAETQVIHETKTYFESNGVDLKAFESRSRGDTAILVKNFPYGVKASELKERFAKHGSIRRLLLPPSGTIAIVEFTDALDAKQAFRALAYSEFKKYPLYLEWAPKDVFAAPARLDAAALNSATDAGIGSQEAEIENPDSATLFVKNLNFSTSQERFHDLFGSFDGFKKAHLKRKKDPRNPEKTLSMGFGFVEFRTADQAKAALLAVNGFSLDGHELAIKASHRPADAADDKRRGETAKNKAVRKSKIIIKNLPFEATKKDVSDLFKRYGQLRAVRVPKKFDNSRKGFAFAEFTTPKEAENALDALRHTHLLGRRLVLEVAAGDSVDPEIEIKKMQEKIGRQSDNAALQKLTVSQRKKFSSNVDEAERDDE